MKKSKGENTKNVGREQQWMEDVGRRVGLGQFRGHRYSIRMSPVPLT